MQQQWHGVPICHLNQREAPVKSEIEATQEALGVPINAEGMKSNTAAALEIAQ